MNARKQCHTNVGHVVVVYTLKQAQNVIIRHHVNLRHSLLLFY